ncbi:MAG: TOMM precursor leader peptide-binding protein [Bacteroidales bacterium]|nr:TOMM precursor leader peptide-binding protein [Bacteroidales bacterium]
MASLTVNENPLTPHTMSLRKAFDIFNDKENGGYQIRTKSEIVVVEFDNPQKESIFNAIVDLYDGHPILSFDFIMNRLSDQYTSDDITDVVQELLTCGVLTHDNLMFSTDSLSAPTNYSQELSTNADAAGRYAVGLIGEGEMAELLDRKSQALGFKSFTATKLPAEFHKYEMVVDKIFAAHDFIIVDSTRWNPYALNIINTIALAHNKPWILVEGKTSSIHFGISPIFHGKHTGCYECYRSRLRSNDEFISYTSAYENFLQSNHIQSKADSTHVFILELAASIIIMDIARYLCNWYVPETWRTNITINMQNYKIEHHHFLKAPLCHCCKPELDYSPYPWLEEVTLK